MDLVNCSSDPFYRWYFLRRLTRLTFTAGDGTEYELRDQLTGGQVSEVTNGCTAGASRGTVFVTADGSAATFVSDATIYDANNGPIGRPTILYPSGYLMLRDGTRYRIDNGLVSWMRDRNGNKLSFTYDTYKRVTSIADSLNRQVTVNYDVTDGSYGLCDQIVFKGFGGAQRIIRVSKTNLGSALRSGYSLGTYASLFPELNGSSGTMYDPTVVSSVWLPDGTRRYQLQYNSYGEVARIVMPTGGAIEYDYTSGSGAVTDGVDYQISRRVTARRVYPDGSTLEGKTAYSATITGSSGSEVTTVTVDQLNPSNALLAREKHYYNGSPTRSLFQDPLDYEIWNDGKEYQTEAIDTNGTTVLRRSENTWQQGCTVSGWSSTIPNNPRISVTTSTLVDANQVSKETFSYDCYNNKTDVYEFDYGSGSPPTYATRRSHIDYLTTNSVNSASYDTDTSIHIRSLPLQQIVYSVNPSNGTETWVAQTKYEYDRYDASTNHTALVNRSSISGLDSTFTTSYTTRGNATQIDRWLNSSGSSLLSTWAQYDIAGNAVKAIDARGYAANFEFNDRFGSPDDDARANSAPSELSGLSSFAFPTKVTNALGHEAYTQYDYYLGKPVNAEDANGIVSSVTYNETLDRPTQTMQARYKYGSGATSAKRQTTITYDDANRRITTTTDRDSFNDNILTAKSYADGLGRTWRSAAYEGNTGAGNTWAITDTQFDALGRVLQVSNPYRAADPNTASPPSGTWTTKSYDALSRITAIQTPDTATVTTIYSGNQTTVTDQAGKVRRSFTNALGQLSQVVEDPSGVNYSTAYQYNALDNLVKVTQGSQNRYFMYDSLSRLIRAKNVEQAANGSIALSDPLTGNSQWSMAYSYDANGNMLTRVDARNVTTTYTYDNLNRNTSVTYNDGVTPGLNRYYDEPTVPNGKGRLYYSVSYNTHPVTSALAYSYTQVNSYDALGRITSQTQNLLNSSGAWVPYTMTRTYNLAGNVLTQNYPSTRTTTYAYNTAAQLASFTGTLGDGTSRNYATGITYTPAGLMSRETFGMQASTLYHNLHYNNRQQLVDIRVGDSSTDEWNWSRGALVYYYGTTARDSWNAFANSMDNNGNVLRQINYVPLSGGGYEIPQLDDYTYDALNRNTSVTEAQQNSAGTWTFNLFTQNFGYDRWGNRTVSCSPCQSGVTGDTFTIDTTTNRITAKNGTGITYDSAGNQTYDATGNRWFDGENRMYKAVQSGTTSYYVYDADGKRVRRIVGATETWMVYGIDGELVAEYTANGSASSPQKEYGYRGGQMLIVAQTSPLEIRWTVPDHLGTPRMNILGTGASGGLLSSVKRHDYLPFGEELFAGVGLRSSSNHGYEPPSDEVRQKFGSKERDTETGLDFFEARYFSNTQGRFTSNDPYNIVIETQYNPNSKKAKSLFLSYLNEPQKWNRYPYTLNNPMRYTDPTGEEVVVYYREGAGSGNMDFGHILIYVRNDDTGEAAYFDYYGENGSSAVLGDVDQKRLDEHASITISTTAEQEQAILDAIKGKVEQGLPNFNSNGVVADALGLGKPEYHTSVCTIQCRDVLKAGSIKTDATTPASFWANISGKYGDNVQIIRERGTRLEFIGSTPGVEYGKGQTQQSQGRKFDPTAYNTKRQEWRNGKPYKN